MIFQQRAVVAYLWIEIVTKTCFRLLDGKVTFLVVGTLVVLGIEPSTLHTLGKHSTAEQCAHSLFNLENKNNQFSASYSHVI